MGENAEVNPVEYDAEDYESADHIHVYGMQVTENADMVLTCPDCGQVLVLSPLGHNHLIVQGDLGARHVYTYPAIVDDPFMYGGSLWVQ